jgi:hypothetical protein
LAAEEAEHAWKAGVYLTKSSTHGRRRTKLQLKGLAQGLAALSMLCTIWFSGCTLDGMAQPPVVSNREAMIPSPTRPAVPT